MNVKALKYIFSRGLPKSTQSVVYQAGDDGTYQVGWWRGKLATANRTRFIQKTIGSDKIVIDRATGLMWAADAYAAGCGLHAQFNFADAIAEAEGLDFAGFTDWRLPNINELLSIVRWSTRNPAIALYYFPGTEGSYYRCSTTYAVTTSKQWIVHFVDGAILTAEAHHTHFIRCVRQGL